MGRPPLVDVIIPALDEEQALPLVLRDLRAQPWPLRHIVVVDNGSTDRTAEVAEAAGAVVLKEPQRGYGAACLRGLRFLSQLSLPPDVVVFLDGDYSDDPAEVAWLLDAIEAGADLAIGSRVLGRAEPGSLTPQQRIGNILATTLIRLVYGQRYTDLGPMRAIRYPALCALAMRDTGYGWTVEMQVKAVRLGLRVVEVPVSYRRRRGGASKVSGTLRGTLGAGYKILYTVLRHATAR
ncbi:MAG: glycosyltransferase family 2 protein [Myxococcales bacterium]|nr:glycosyltransferase family 2 protein [Myxococcota bacterium]MDW8282000.1 glycosyltransferase family 2 protein [Myxococcales bacterium]